MATVNRYTQLQPARYNPRSLQEMMVAPSYMREQHDALDLGRAELETQLAQVDPLSIHGDLAKAEQERLYNQMSKQADTLAKQGFTQTSKSDFIRLNKDYQQSIGPTGMLGKINAAKIAAETQKAEILNNAVQQGHDPQESQKRIDEAYANYEQDFVDTGKVENFKAQLPPKYQDLMEDIQKMKVMAGTTVETEKGEEGYDISVDPTTGMLVATTNSGQIITETNAPQLAHALSILNNKWLKENGAGYRHAKWNAQDPEDIAQDIRSGMGLITTSKTQDTTQANYQFMKNPAAQYDQNGKMRDFVSDRIKAFSNTSFSPDSVLRQTDYITDVKYDEDGYIDPNQSKYPTYKDKVDDFKREFPGLVEFDEARGVATYLNTITHQMVDIPMEGNHLIGKITQLRDDNPYLKELSDKQIIDLIQDQKVAMTSSFAESIDLIGADYKWLNTRFFGSESGADKTTGDLNTQGATIDGTHYDPQDVYKQLGYSNLDAFKKSAKPSIKGYVPAAGMFRATVLDSSGESRTIFIEGTEQLQGLTPVIRKVSKAILNGSSFENLGPSRANPGYTLYMVNNFTDNPDIILSKNGNVKAASELLSNQTIAGGAYPILADFKNSSKMSFKDYAAMEKKQLLSSDHFARISGVGTDKK